VTRSAFHRWLIGASLIGLLLLPACIGFPDLPGTTPIPAPSPPPAPSPTTAGGEAVTWRETSVQGADLRILARADNGTLYAAGENVIYRSTDGGGTWTQQNTGFRVSQLSVARANAQVLYAGTWLGCGSGEPGELHRSLDGGATWAAVTGGPRSLIVDDANTLLGIECDGVYRSTDGAKTWSKLPNSDVTNLDGALLARGVNDRAYLYGLYVAEGGSVALRRSTDGGRTWTTLTDPQLRGPLDFAVDPKDTKHIYFMGLSGFFSSADGGQRWNAHNQDLPTVEGNYSLTNLALDTGGTPPPGATATLYLGTYSGGNSRPSVATIYRWNGRDAWEPVVSDPAGHSLHQLLVATGAQTRSGRALVAVTDGGIYQLPLP
jgi:photosystem II stability/assembly factor-like uncharacterized protein